MPRRNKWKMTVFTMTRERKFLLIGCAVLLLWGVGYNLYPRLNAWIPPDEMLQLQQDKLVKYRRKVAEKKNLRELQLTLQRQLQILEAGLLEGKTAAMAAVEIQQSLQSLATERGAAIMSMRQQETFDRPAEAPYATVAVEVTIAATMDQIVDLLHAIETAPRIQRVKEMTLRTAGRVDRGDILATLTIEGFVKTRSP